MDFKIKIAVNDDSIRAVLAYFPRVDFEHEYYEIFITTFKYNVKQMAWTTELQNFETAGEPSNPNEFLKKVNDYRLLILRIEEALKEETDSMKISIDFNRFGSVQVVDGDCFFFEIDNEESVGSISNEFFNPKLPQGIHNIVNGEINNAK